MESGMGMEFVKILFINVNKKLIDIYEQYKDADGILYVVF